MPLDGGIPSVHREHKVIGVASVADNAVRVLAIDAGPVVRRVGIIAAKLARGRLVAPELGIQGIVVLQHEIERPGDIPRQVSQPFRPCERSGRRGVPEEKLAGILQPLTETVPGLLQELVILRVAVSHCVSSYTLKRRSTPILRRRNCSPRSAGLTRRALDGKRDGRSASLTSLVSGTGD